MSDSVLLVRLTLNIIYKDLMKTFYQLVLPVFALQPANEYPRSPFTPLSIASKLANIFFALPSGSVAANLSSFIQLSPCCNIFRARVEPPSVQPIVACSVARVSEGDGS